MALRLGILTISDACSRGERADSSGDLIASSARERQYTVAERGLIPDDTVRISVALAEWADTDRADLILTTGGTGLTECVMSRPKLLGPSWRRRRRGSPRRSG